VINHSQQPRKPTDNTMFSQIHTRVIIHETTSTLPYRGGAEGVSYIVYHHAIRLFGRPEQIPTLITLVDSKAPLTHKSAPITSWGHVYNYRWSCDCHLATCTTTVFFFHAHLRRPVGCEKQMGTARFTKPLELKKRPTRRVWALVQLHPPWVNWRRPPGGRDGPWSVPLAAAGRQGVVCSWAAERI
jgi:hypothetical protein